MQQERPQHDLAERLSFWVRWVHLHRWLWLSVFLGIIAIFFAAYVMIPPTYVGKVTIYLGKINEAWVDPAGIVTQRIHQLEIPEEFVPRFKAELSQIYGSQQPSVHLSKVDWQDERLVTIILESKQAADLNRVLEKTSTAFVKRLQTRFQALLRHHQQVLENTRKLIEERTQLLNHLQKLQAPTGPQIETLHAEIKNLAQLRDREAMLVKLIHEANGSEPVILNAPENWTEAHWPVKFPLARVLLTGVTIGFFVTLGLALLSDVLIYGKSDQRILSA